MESVQKHRPRNSWQVTKSVWHALFMREALARTTADRMAWFWMLAEPIAMIAVFVGIRAVAASGHRIGGADFIPWLICGLLGFYLFRENMMRSLGAIGASKALFAYRQVKPIDPVLIRCYLEGMLKSLVFLMFILVCSLIGIDLVPDDPLNALFIWAAIWLLGVGVGLTISVLDSLIPEVGKIIRILSLPLMIISGAMIPLNYLPHNLQQILLLNPIVHGIESLRLAFFSSYRSLPDINMLYLWGWGLGLVALGLMLHLRFEMRLKAQ
ncbi:ABC transporter permease [Neptunomonas japonica]|uniref:Transport permease protein n=1 Tax=Neptunomonas japonica JAMM 1380 TaxID=1441457 RepID=A0A7R6PTP1_9GAMM|nr:ABC transporter permease [Neptunomonas japonica]BBB30260.1 capsular polysaccharide transport system permease protein [Neptunomonas japonica JAMM 1380]